jgi:hypothetical protein
MEGRTPDMTVANKQRRPWGRIVAGVIATVILSFAGWCLYSAFDWQNRADAARVAEPIRLKADLSKPGLYKGPFHHTFTAACSNHLMIATEPLSASREEAEAAADGLRASWAIAGPQGEVVSKGILDARVLRGLQLEHGLWCPAVEFGHFPAGDYELTLTVSQGSPKLSSVPHAVVACYNLCGVEYVPVQVLRLIAVVGGVIGGILVLAIVIVTLERRSLAGAADSPKTA